MLFNSPKIAKNRPVLANDEGRYVSIIFRFCPITYDIW